MIPRYISISQAIKDAMVAGRLETGQVLTEEPLARHFGTSRTTVRKALAELHSEKIITRFEGRGFLVGTDSSVPPRRDSIEQVLFDSTASRSVPRALSNPDQILPVLRDELIRALPFGPLQINESKLTERFSVSRSVVRDMLTQLRSSGIVEKNERSKWVLPVLTALDVRNHYQLRILLEPVALAEVAPYIEKSHIERALARARELDRQEGDLNAEDISEIEDALHVLALSGCRNDHLLKILQKSRLVLAINEMFRLLLGRSPETSRLISEHIAVFEALARNDTAAAGSLLEFHLLEARERTCKRLQTLAVLLPPKLPSYLTPGTISISQAALIYRE
ncbi:GntR family transcriptional regulator [Pelagibacterium sp.]|uniref:GntR family transcriptional regulator n=1 Tax=Pelagibacterium sp. TaxID=1967288 RepID=UPI003A8D2F26